MEFFVLLAEFLLDLDYRKRPLNKLIPQLSMLRKDPGSALAGEPIVIESSYLVGTFLLVMLCFLLVTCCPFAFLLGQLWEMAGAAQWPETTRKLALVGMWLLFFVVGSLTVVGLAGHWLRDRKIILQLEGVDFSDRRSVVRCPWILFRTSERSWQKSHRSVVIPVVPEAIDLLEQLKEDVVIAIGREVRNKCVRFDKHGQFVMSDCYHASGPEIAGLLAELAARLR